MGADTRRKNSAGRRYLIVAKRGKMTELIEHRGSLQSAHEKALHYVAKGRYKIKRMVQTEIGEFWRDVRVVGDYDG
jgi:hypothetical protein